MDKKSEYTSVRDEQTMAQYAYGPTGMVSYDDERAICDKTEYAQVHGLNSYIIWELSGDLMPDLSTPLLDAANAKLLDPSMDCASFDLSDYIQAAMSDSYPKSDEGAPEAEDSQDNSPPSADAVVAAKVESHTADIMLPYYPSTSGHVCLADGKQQSWLAGQYV
mmetsp:Transcript_28384/g.48957  ORF Transcript_28384/g.48957 Transcript_28384/m.48957 type:complete len:164 (+) Transcript_28384:635-1126(+)